jgi:hypothetical protein
MEHLDSCLRSVSEGHHGSLEPSLPDVRLGKDPLSLSGT